ncbi:LacI family DNA-binding transcriptional regulator [Enterococcus quebecensis]|uniref:LacI family transcriptional regulator n=1 Tax=Enterococcus quebecensis TaxID=903983 RepID=A0A1E5H2L0_9ENTE|nr:LacI family DNA-binding transcriptional regulator [Enterococcus quebecensis]OEG19114.1 LacI family transcriptional regulator [Enterococcus quebecensis]OJG75983.1 LacI family sugar-binding transcriptional regulator [Enterococcus quebecensis]
MTTIIDVAKQAQVSKSTVSRVISGNGYVSQESRKKVLDAMEALSYSPNLIARNLQSGETKTIGFLAHGFFDPLGIFLESFISIAKHYNYYVTLYFTDGDKAKEIDALNQMKYKQLDGVFILTRANEWEVIEPYSIYGPIATWHRIDSERIYSSYVDHYSGYLRSLNYLFQRGYHSIGHVLGNSENLNTKARLRAIADFHNENHIPNKSEWIFHDNARQDNGRIIARQWHSMANRTDAMAFYTDSVAASFISELQILGYSIPEDVAVIGFDNSEISRLMHITTVDYSIKHQAENSFIYIHNQLNKKTIAERKMSVQLIERSTVPVRSDKKKQ